MDDQSCGREALREGLRRVCSTLKQGQIPFAVAGGNALWVHGARESDHDVDVVVADSQVEDAVRCLDRAGFLIERPPEDWLFKAWWGPAMVDVIHRLHTGPVDERVLARAQDHEMLGVRVPVLPAQDVIMEKLLTLREQYCDLSGLFGVVRGVREQLDWAALAQGAGHNELAFAFLVAAERLGISDYHLSTDTEFTDTDRDPAGGSAPAQIPVPRGAATPERPAPVDDP